MNILVAQPRGTDASGVWPRLAKCVQTEAELQQFFSQRQNPAVGGKLLQIASAVKVVNNATLHAFATSRNLHMNPMKVRRCPATRCHHRNHLPITTLIPTLTSVTTAGVAGQWQLGHVPLPRLHAGVGDQHPSGRAQDSLRRERDARPRPLWRARSEKVGAVLQGLAKRQVHVHLPLQPEARQARGAGDRAPQHHLRRVLRVRRPARRDSLDAEAPDWVDVARHGVGCSERELEAP